MDTQAVNVVELIKKKSRSTRILISVVVKCMHMLRLSLTNHKMIMICIFIMNILISFFKNLNPGSFNFFETKFDDEDSKICQRENRSKSFVLKHSINDNENR
jgi:hypothetical protein